MVRAFLTVAFVALGGCAADNLLERGQSVTGPAADPCTEAATAQAAVQDDCPDADPEPPAATVSFAEAVQPILQRCVGCHAGGAGGWTYDGGPQAYAQTVARIDPDDAAGSSLLRKGSNQSSHGGGALFTEDSEEYAAVLAWIASGAPDN